MIQGGAAGGFDPASGCAGKERFTCSSDAQRQVVRSIRRKGSKKGVRLVAYSCLYCSGWHVGRNTSP